MNRLDDLLHNNRAWAERVSREDPGFFERLSGQQAPKYLWIGCSDSRVPANQVVDLAPGEVFVHRNVANLVVHTDLNCLSTIQFAVDVLKVEHVLVVGHYGCGGVHASLTGVRVGLADNWIRHVKDVAHKHMALIKATTPEWRHNVLCELNAIEQVINIAHTTVMQDAWARGDKVTLHGWCFGLNDGIIKNLHISVNGNQGLDELHDAAVAGVAAVRR